MAAAGYGFDEGIGACINVWEFDERERAVFSRAVESVGRQDGLALVGVEQGPCFGCSTVHFDVYGRQFSSEVSSQRASVLAVFS